MDLTESIKTAPLTAERSIRTDEIRGLTSCRAGIIHPVAYVPLLREDRVSRGSVRLRVEMAETVKTLMNAVNVTAYAHFVPFLAFERFNGLDQFNRSYKGIPETEGGSVVPFFETDTFVTSGILDAMGIHVSSGDTINTAVVEAYNVLVNFRRQARSAKLPLRPRLAPNPAAGFWKNTAMRDIVPDFDSAVMDGEVHLTGKVPVTGIGVAHPQPAFDASAVGSKRVTNRAQAFPRGWSSDETPFHIYGTESGYPNIFAEMENSGVVLTLANIELAKKTAAFAQMRKQYSGLDDDHLIDLLMEAVRVPDAQMAQPILLDRRSTIVGYSRRYATDGASLDQSVTTGETYLDLKIRTPQMNTGGLILITMEIVPEQLFERQQDHFVYTTTVDDLPSFTRDYLDPEKVAVVQNRHVDVEHTDPDGTFGYAPLNHQWRRSIPKIGGKFMRQMGDPFDENRQRIWSVETTDPALTDDFYLVNEIHHKVFADSNEDPFEITALGNFEIVGNTVFGKMLEENTGDWDALQDDIDHTRV